MRRFMRPLSRLPALPRLVFLAAGFAAAVRHLWILHQPLADCGFDPIEKIVNGMFLAKLL